MINERDTRHERVMLAAGQMMTAARTAPKAKGMDIVEVAVVEGEDIKRLSDRMREMFDSNGLHFFLRDADNILSAECIVLVGTQSSPLGMNCGYCGFAHCADRTPGVPCAFNINDVGIAVGSACATAADLRLDTRVMFSAGQAAMTLGWPCKGCTGVIAIAVSASSKNPFFDRKPKQ